MSEIQHVLADETEVQGLRTQMVQISALFTASRIIGGDKVNLRNFLAWLGEDFHKTAAREDFEMLAAQGAEAFENGRMADWLGECDDFYESGARLASMVLSREHAEIAGNALLTVIPMLDDPEMRANFVKFFEEVLENIVEFTGGKIVETRLH